VATGKLKGEPGALLEKLNAWARERWLDAHLLLDEPGTSATVPAALLKKHGLHVLGRTGAGFFSVERESPVLPIDARPIFFIPFGSREVVRAAENLHAFLLHHESLREARPQLTSRLATFEAPPNRAASVPVKKQKKAKTISASDLNQLASDALRALGAAVGLVFAIENVELKKKAAVITVCVQLPETVEPLTVAKHPLSKEVSSALVTAVEDHGLTAEVIFWAGPLAPDPIAHLSPIVRRCPKPERVITFLESFAPR
jgi:hypothetical protein